jgi:uncharacterized protein (TIGR02646 family)
VTYIGQVGASFQDMDPDIKENLKKSLLKEQGWVCGYCQQKLRIDNMKIEHFCEQSICNGSGTSQDKRLDYTNLMAVCIGSYGYNELHCDASKANFNSGSGLPIEVSPWIVAHMRSLKYHSTGVLDSTKTRFTDEINRILNLNIKYLKDRRKEKFTQIFKLSKHDVPAKRKAKMKRLLECDLLLDGEKFTTHSPGLSEYMLKKFC